MTIIEMTDIYELARVLRSEADKSGNPDDYRKAAAEFRRIGWYAAAALCDEKARYCAESDK